jgi:8-oxo-dGTP pyrophosphatase MutT (NUDIX family)
MRALVTDLLDVEGPNPWRTESTRVIFEDSRLRLREDRVVQPDGEPGVYVYLEVHTPIVGVVPIDDEGHVYLVRQWRYPWRRNSWEIPSGGGEPGESPLEAAQRELAEEVGLQAAHWEAMAGGHSSATLTGQWHFFMARGLQPVNTARHQRDGAEQDLIARRVPLATAVDAALDGRIEHGMSVVGLLRAARRLGI